MNQNKAILLLMILQAINSNCSDGCLKCDIANRCQVCDVTSFYIQRNGVCVEKAPENCAMIDKNGDCFRCKSSYFQDFKTGKCIQVPKDQQIEYCRFYRNSKECQVCETGFYLDEGYCLPVEIHVPGCLVNGKDTCLECRKGMILHPSRERCVENPNSDKCLVYGYLDCLECKEGHVLNSNYRVKNLLDTPNDGQLGEFLRSVTEGRVDFRLKSNCEPVSVPDCEIFETFSKCKQCRPFYLLTEDKKCKPYPLPSIPYCYIYGNYNLCLSCMQGYKLNSPSECIKVKQIQNCSTYNTTTSANICTECEEGFYLFSNTCRERLNIVEFCEQNNLSKDECSQCKPGYVLTDDSLKCISGVQNCQSYSPSTSQTTQLTCVKCNETYYLKDNACVIGGIANCQNYLDVNTCTKCQNGFYIKNDVTPNVCVQQTTIEKCDNYSTTVKDKCDFCSNDSIMVIQKKGCTAIKNKVANCNEYSNTTTCSECQEGYYLTNNTCQVIAEEENCLQKDINNDCTKCKDGYYKDSGECYKPLDYQQKQCVDWNQVNTPQSFECEGCQQFTLPWVVSANTSLCATREQIKVRKGFQTKILNCLIHEDDGNTQKCLRCEKDFYISEDRLSCKQSCPNITLIDQNKDFDKRVNRCIQNNNLQNCAKAVQTQNQYVCIKCKTGFLQSVQNNENRELIALNPHDLTVNVGLHYLGFACIQKTNGVQYETTQSQNPSPNCETFTVGNNGKLYCTRCKFGYTGNYFSTNDPNLVNLKCDNKIKDCDLNTYYGGLLNNQQAVTSLVNNKYHLLNCHKCLTKGKIPFLFTDEQLEVKQFSLEYGNEDLTSQQLNNSEWLQCLRPQPESFKMTPERFSSVFPKNCGMGQFQVTKDKDFRLFTEEFNSLKCLFCKPGFRPVYQVKQNEHIIVDCVEIQNCDQPMMQKNQWFSACSQCKPYHSWVYEQETEFVNYDQCVKTVDYNCMVVSNKNLKDKFNNHKSEKCLLCKPGFSLNYDGVCERLTHELCQDGEFQMDYKYFFNSNSINNTEHLIEMFGTVQTGCSRCKEGYEGMVWDTNYHVCLNSPYLLKHQFYEKTNYIPNCQRYYLENNKLKCEQCLPDFISLETNQKCIKKSSQPNCLIVHEEMKTCKVCLPGFVRVLGFCEKPQIKYCKTYDDNENKQTCTKCEERFALYNNHCYPGKVQNCKVYNTNRDCVQCDDQHQLLELKNSQYCVPVPESLNCESYMNITNDDRELRCLTCNDGFVNTENDEDLIQSICLPIIPIENCEVYDNQLLLSQTTLKCNKCVEQFFLKDNRCLERKVSTQNCKSYSPVNDYCSECLEGYYMTNLKECQSYPTGIYGCVEYETETVCHSCQKNMYLSSNTCVKVPKQQRIENCDIYADIGVCDQCQFNFYLEENECVPAKAQNCMEYEDEFRCASCPVGFGLQLNEQRRTLDCVHISTQNCLISKNFYPFDCIKCTKLFYQDKGRCFANDKFIPHCDEYLSRDTCKKCESGFVLSYDNERCLSAKEFGLTPSDSCANNVQSQRPFCYACEFGHKFYKNQCIQCRQQTLDAGCLYCEGLEKEICLICKPGYFQDVSGRCYRNGTTPDPIVDQTKQVTQEDLDANDEQDLIIEEMNTENVEKRKNTYVILN